MYDSLEVNFYVWCEIMIKAHFFSFWLSNCPSTSCWKDYHFPIILPPFLRSVDDHYEYLQSLTVWITTNYGKLLKRWEYQTPWPASWEICMHVKKKQLELDMEQQTGSKLGKEYVKAVYCHPAYFTYRPSTSWEMLDWMKQKLESRLLGEILLITSDMQMTVPLWQKAKKNWRASWWKWWGEGKSWLKAQHWEN